MTQSLMGLCMHSLSFHGDITFFGQVPVEHQFAMPQVVQHWPKVRRVSVNEIGTGFILKESRKKKETISGMPKALLLQKKKKRNQQESASQSTLVRQGLSSNT